MIKKLTSTAVATLTILTMMNTGAVFADSKDANEKEPVALVNVEKLNIRSGPSTSYDIIGSFEKEDSVDLISIKDGWYKIKLEDGKKAWTNGQYITLDGEVTVDKLNVRKGPAITLNSPGGTLANGYAAWAAAHGHSPVFRPVNRIDKDTSGLVLAAKNAYAAPLLAGRVTKLYYAIAQGALPLGEGVIDAPIGRRGDSIIGRCVTPEGKPSRTEYTIIREENGLSLAACVPVTGRTHQIRVHFASIGHPLAGDDLYGGSRERIARQALHCARQSFAVPVYTPLPDGIRVEMPLQLRTVTVESPLPPDMEALFS